MSVTSTPADGISKDPSRELAGELARLYKAFSDTSPYMVFGPGVPFENYAHVVTSLVAAGAICEGLSDPSELTKDDGSKGINAPMVAHFMYDYACFVLGVMVDNAKKGIIKYDAIDEFARAPFLRKEGKEWVSPLRRELDNKELGPDGRPMGAIQRIEKLLSEDPHMQRVSEGERAATPIAVIPGKNIIAEVAQECIARGIDLGDVVLKIEGPHGKNDRTTVKEEGGMLVVRSATSVLLGKEGEATRKLHYALGQSAVRPLLEVAVESAPGDTVGLVLERIPHVDMVDASAMLYRDPVSLMWLVNKMFACYYNLRKEGVQHGDLSLAYYISSNQVLPNNLFILPGWDQVVLFDPLFAELVLRRPELHLKDIKEAEEWLNNWGAGHQDAALDTLMRVYKRFMSQ